MFMKKMIGFVLGCYCFMGSHAMAASILESVENGAYYGQNTEQGVIRGTSERISNLNEKVLYIPIDLKDKVGNIVESYVFRVVRK